jgi:hypothetical protein
LVVDREEVAIKASEVF